MTKKKALKQIMSMGFQRNEAQQRLLTMHNRGFSNIDAAFAVALETLSVSAGLALEECRRLEDAARAICEGVAEIEDSCH